MVSFRDIRLAFRVIVKRPGFSITVILTLAIGVAACVATFRWIDAIVLHPLPGVADASRIVSLESTTPSGTTIDSSYPDFRSFRDAAGALAGLTAMKDRPLSLGRGQGAKRVWAQLVAGNFFDVLGVRPELGRFFTADEKREVPGAAPVAIVSDSLWRNRYAADPRLVGSTILLNSRPMTVIGVAPPEFQGTISGLRFDVFVPLFEYGDLAGDGGWLEDRNSRPIHLQGRLAKGATVASADREIESIAKALAAKFPDSNRGVGATARAFADARYGAARRLRPILFALGALSIVFLMLISANVAGLLLARASGRAHELAIRGALGASRGQALRPVLAEGLLLCGIGGTGGIALSVWLEGLFLALVPASEYSLAGFAGVDSRALLAGAACTLIAAFGATVLPCWLASRASGVDSLRGSAGNSVRTPRLRACLVAGEIALATVALSAAALFLDGLRRAGAIDPGFRTDRVLLAGFNLSWSGYSADDARGFYRRLLPAARSLPGATAAALSEDVPLGFSGGSWETLEITGYTPAENENMKIYRNLVSPGYFRLLEIPIVEGREFSDRDDRSSARVAVVNQTFARRYFGKRDPLGLTFRGWDETITIVGVSRDTKIRRLDESPQPYFYVPLEQFARSDTGVALHIATGGAPASVLPELRSAIARLDPRVTLLAALPLSDYTAAAVAEQRVAASVLSALALLALALAGVGLFGVVAYTVEQRRREIGVRMALGATGALAAGIVVFDGMRTAAGGLLAGLAGSMVVGRLIASAAFEASPASPVLVAAVSAAMLAVAFLAAYIPARRAASVDPMTALRSE